MITIATRWERSKSEPCLEAVETRRFGSRSAALSWAKSVLEPIVTTNDCYHRDVGRAGHVELTSQRSSRLSYSFTRGRCSSKSLTAAGHVSPEVIIVPSCGELGYW
jgi:hypothetical protein